VTSRFQQVTRIVAKDLVHDAKDTPRVMIRATKEAPEEGSNLVAKHPIITMMMFLNTLIIPRGKRERGHLLRTLIWKSITVCTCRISDLKKKVLERIKKVQRDSQGSEGWAQSWSDTVLESTHGCHVDPDRADETLPSCGPII
jgi:hypothetical protein